ALPEAREPKPPRARARRRRRSRRRRYVACSCGQNLRQFVIAKTSRSDNGAGKGGSPRLREARAPVLARIGAGAAAAVASNWLYGITSSVHTDRSFGAQEPSDARACRCTPEPALGRAG